MAAKYELLPSNASLLAALDQTREHLGDCLNEKTVTSRKPFRDAADRIGEVDSLLVDVELFEGKWHGGTSVGRQVRTGSQKE